MHHTYTKVVRSRKQQLRGTSPPWWAVQDLNLRPHACEACALTTELTARTANYTTGLGTRDWGLETTSM